MSRQKELIPQIVGLNFQTGGLCAVLIAHGEIMVGFSWTSLGQTTRGMGSHGQTAWGTGSHGQTTWVYDISGQTIWVYNVS